MFSLSYRRVLFIVALILAGCFQNNGDMWAYETLGRSEAVKLRSEIREFSGPRAQSAPFLRRPFMVFYLVPGDPEVGLSDRIEYSPSNSSLVGVATSVADVEAFVVVQHRSDHKGYLLKLVDRKSETFTTVLLDSNNDEVVQKALDDLPESSD